MVPRVLVIGAGASGIGALDQLQSSEFIVKCYEGNSKAGGIWQHEKDPDELEIQFDAQGRPIVQSTKERNGWQPSSAVYDGLRTVSPYPAMSYRGHPFPDLLPLFPSHTVIKEYLERTASRFSHCIEYGRKVTRLRLTKKKPDVWTVTSTKLDGSESRQEEFDFVVCANGHYQFPYIPFINGLWTSQLRIIHARSYRRPEQFDGQAILIVGAGASGFDITRQICTHRFGNNDKTRVYQSVRSKTDMYSEVKGPESVLLSLVAPISQITGSSIQLADGTLLDTIDTIIFATGYFQSYPFCLPEDEPWRSFPLVKAPEVSDSPPDPIGAATFPNVGRTVHNLDSGGLFYYPHPSFIILALHYGVHPFAWAQTQTRFAAARWTKFPGIPIHPGLDHDQTGLADETLLKKEFIIGANQFDAEDKMTSQIGEGEGSEEVDERGKFGKVPQWRRGLRASAIILKQASLGY